MFLSFSAEGKTYSRIMRIRGSSLNLERINRVNDISRRCVRQPMPCEEIMAELMQIREVRNYRPKTVTLAGGFIAMCFTPFFGGSLSDALAAFPIGMATQFLVQKCEQLQINFIVRIISTSVILTNFWNARFKGSFTKKEEAMTLALEKQGRVGVDLASLTKDERKALVKEGMGLLKAKRQAEKAKEAK